MSVINTATNKVTRTIAVGDSPGSVVVLPDGSAAYVANWADDTVSVINTRTGKVTETIPVGVSRTLPGVLPDGSAVDARLHLTSDRAGQVLDSQGSHGSHDDSCGRNGRRGPRRGVVA